MQLENRFEVPAPPPQVWDFLLDVEQVAPCMPGAELTEVVDDQTWKGRITVTLGPVKMTYTGKVAVQQRDDEQHRMVLEATGSETRGKGTAHATVASRLAPSGDGTAVELSTDLTLSGAAAQYGRGMVADVSKRLTDQFADCLRQRLEAPEPAAAADEGAPQAAAPRPAEPVSGLRLGLWSLWRALVRGLRRLVRRG